MPIYEYQCQSCGHILQELQSMSEAALVKCPNCGKNELKRLIGSGAGLIFKGSGFYLTDYKKKSKEKTDTVKPDQDKKSSAPSAEKTETAKQAKTETKQSKTQPETDQKK